MKEERYFYVPDAEQNTQLPQDEAVHATRVLRLREGETIYLMDGVGCFYKAQVSMVSNKKCCYEIIEKLPQERQWNGNITIAMAPTKMMDRVEWFAEKATEIGVDEFSFLECKFSERRQIKIERVDKIVVAATKQSRKAWKPKVHEMCSFEQFVAQPRTGQKYICHCYDEIEREDLFESLKNADKAEDVTILVGPEGDFSIDEVRQACSQGYKSVSLGTSRLRTETAALSAAFIAQLSKRK